MQWFTEVYEVEQDAAGCASKGKSVNYTAMNNVSIILVATLKSSKMVVGK